MPINFVTGLPRQGKTLFTFVQVRERAERENRPVYYCNIPEVTIPGWQEIDHPDKWMDCPNDSIIIVDELQDFWGAASSGARVPLPILELSKHGKRGIDFYFITQDPTLVHATPRKLCETHWHVIRAFGSENAMAHKFNRMQTDPEKVKTKSEKFPWRYPKDAFGKKDRAGNWISKPWYKSADVHNIKRQIPLKIWAIPGGLVLACLAIWIAISMFGGVIDRAKTPGDATAAAASVAPGARPPVATSGPALAPITAAQYLEQRRPRVPDFPHTAPAYDQVTQPVEAPYPAACVQMGSRCDCYSQQGTFLRVSADNCAQIVKHGFFMDWKTTPNREIGHGSPRQVLANGSHGPRERHPGTPAEPKPVRSSIEVPPAPVPQPGEITQADIAAGYRAAYGPAHAGISSFMR